MRADSQLFVFFAASAALILTPGPAVLYILARSATQGRRAGLVSAAGVGLGNFGHAITAALGASAVLASSTLAYSVLKYAGAGYLIYLGIRKFSSGQIEKTDATFAKEPLGSTFRQAVLVAVLNPKTALFFVAFLPQFIVQGRGPASLQLLALGSAFVVMAIASDAAYALLAGALAGRMQQRSGLFRAGRWASGAVYLGLGIATALSHAPVGG